MGPYTNTRVFATEQSQITRTKQTRKKAREHRFNDVQQLPTSSRQKERKILFKSINSGYKQWEQYPYLYRQIAHKEKKTKSSKFGLEMNSDCNLKIAKNTGISTARRAC